MAWRWMAMGLGCVLAAAAMGGRAEASAKPSYGKPPSWVDVAPLPAAPPAEGAPALQVLLDDNQSRLGPDGNSFYSRRTVKVLRPEALSDLTSETVTWSPDTEDLVIHTLAILRDGKVIDLLKGKPMLVLRRETGLEMAMLDGRLTATRQIEGLQVGDVLDFAWTLTRRDPVMKGHSEDPEGLSARQIERYRVKISWPSGDPIRWRAAPGLAAPTITTHDGRTELLLDMSKAKLPDAPVGAPARFHWLAHLEASSFTSWKEASALVSPLFQHAAEIGPDSPLRAEAAAIAARSADPKVRAFEALKLVEEKTRYFYVGTNDGGYVPAAADETWRRRFGDCKGKTVLLLSLLRQLGIDAEPALVSTEKGDGLDQTLPGLLFFDHVIVRARIEGRTYWLDGTREGDVAGLDSLQAPGWRWALPLRPGGAELEPIVQAPLDQPMMDALMRVDATKGLDAPAPTKMVLRLRGDAAIELRQLAARAGKDDLQRAFTRAFGNSLQWFEPKTIDWRDDPKADAFDLDLEGVSDLDWRENADVHAREFRMPAQSNDVRAFPRRETGPGEDTPFAMAFPMYVKAVFEVALPDGGKGFSVRGPNLSKTIAGYEIQHSAALDGNVARFVGSVRTLATEISADQAQSANKELRRLGEEPELIRQDLAQSSKRASLP